MLLIILKSLYNCPYVNFHVNEGLSTNIVMKPMQFAGKNMNTLLYLKAKDAMRAPEI